MRDRIEQDQPGRLAEIIVAGRAHPDADVDDGRAPVSFFVPDVIRALARLRVVRHPGLDAIDDLYQSMLGNSAASPAEAHLIDMR